jgi:hypothetical protein
MGAALATGKAFYPTLRGSIPRASTVITPNNNTSQPLGLRRVIGKAF